MHTYVVMGVVFSLLALVFWGVGDFLIQKTTRLVGSWKAVFYIGVTGSVILFPFVIGQFRFLSWSEIGLLLFFSVLTLVASIFDFEALRKGKMAVVEPIIGLELPITIALSVIIRGEDLSFFQAFLMAVVFVGIVFVTTSKRVSRRSVHAQELNHSNAESRRVYIFEKGVLFAIVGALGMSGINFVVGVGSQDISPTMTIWFIDTFLAVFSFLYFVMKGNGEWKNLWSDIRRHPRIILLQGILDNAAWFTYGVATTWVSISIAITVSQGYIVLAVLLGLILNHEKITFLQKVGIGLSLGGILILSALVADHFI
ncbi:TPA: hypothetical protein DEP34_03310 [Candidatus Uhrbacteria bacterium]|uniref:EamA domain-containing protein n=2 Tax=Candidatus Uhriibacteriota TaxID=1752732 RepID=A0A0G1T7D5_9BACT|nr:MAG: hypothetical protein UX45_C0001G0101 [Candidatus Uhrbacteria bacterium GW2011_GWF2_46_218]KKU41335.1 MAG: hypothetical protein UX57_C0004G0039 [Candidatus Uhrbacteria bacterium GW2011_GWE2_46_68]HBK33770.1 hypothetical protein [Candidatus Uhrbacteria bacterium]HCB19388.1 hypothetical protein [Candidatus Uhrbacteria bacterium]